MVFSFNKSGTRVYAISMPVIYYGISRNQDILQYWGFPYMAKIFLNIGITPIIHIPGISKYRKMP